MSIVENVKEAVKLVQQLDNVDLMRKMMDVQTDAMDLFDQNTALKKEIERLEDALQTMAKVVVGVNSYWIVREGGGYDGPFCTGCWDSKNRLMRVILTGSSVLQCPVCSTRVGHVAPPKSGE